VWCYGQSEGRIDQDPLIVPLPARPKQVVTFFFGDPYRVHYRASGVCETSPPTVVVGPQTHHRLDLLASGNIDNFTIHFQPAGFHHLFGVPMAEFRDVTYDAPAVMGKDLHIVEQQLAEICSFAERIQLIEAYLIDRLRNAGNLNLVGEIANRLFAKNGLIGVAEMAAASYLTPRQFERRFLEQVGVSPKLYARIVRFNAALDRKLESPQRTWTEIAHELNYYDQMHLVHDFQDLAGDAPARVVTRLDLVPQFHSAFATSNRLTSVGERFQRSRFYYR
jgi:AraC-like DNA-binding protein